MNTKRFFIVLIGAAVVLAGVLIYLGIKSPEAQAEQSAPEIVSASEIAEIQHQRALDVARWEAFGENSSASLSAEQLIQKSRAADAARLTALANAYFPQALLAKSRAADAARLTAMANAYSPQAMLAKSRAADVARWTAMANAFSPQAMLAKSRAAEAARLTAMADAYLSQPSLTKGQAAEAARWRALAEYYSNK
jgi:hypothetical protein